jgi:hypothetical protein
MLVLAAVLVSSSLPAAVQLAHAALPELTAEQIVQRNAAARGGLEAWRGIRSMVWSGHLETGGAGAAPLRFVLQQARPNRTRFELETLGQKNVRVFDGSHGWRQRPSRGIRPDVTPYSAEEVRFAQDADVIDGPLLDFAAHGSRVTLAGLEQEAGRPAWRIEIERASGARESVWIDAETFLDLRYDRTSYKLAGDPVKVPLRYRDYRRYDGVQIPSVVEIGGDGGGAASRMVIEQVTLNPELDPQVFAEPGALFRHAESMPEVRRTRTGPARAGGPGSGRVPVAAPAARNPAAAE